MDTSTINNLLTTATTTSLSFLASHSLTSNVYNLGHAAGQSIRQLQLTINNVNGTDNFMNLDLDLKHILTNYQTWWLTLVKKDPIHVLIETVLLIFLFYLIFYHKKNNMRKQMKDRLSNQEIKFLLKDWKENGRLPLNHDDDVVDIDGINTSQEDMNGQDQQYNSILKNDVIIQSMNGSKLTVTIRKHGPQQKQQKQEQDSGWNTFLKKKQPSTTTTASASAASASNTTTITALNFATYDYLGMACPNPQLGQKDVIKEASITALSKYGCGSCGPRGFYGTIDAHLHLEEAMAKFCRTHGAILYSDGASCAASTIAAFAKRGDLLVVDEGIYEALGTGVTLSRANIKYFQHNDMEDLRRVLERVKATDESLGRKSNDQRRFIVVEALYKNYGTICPLDELVRLKEEFCYRLILDESFSFGSMGKTGRGALEHFGLKPMQHAEIVTINLENAMGSIGGITIGNEEVVDHQRLSGAGYCFSASLPPFLATAAQACLEKMEAEPHILQVLKDNIAYFYDKLQVDLPDVLKITSSNGISPILFLQLNHDNDVSVNIDAMTRRQQIDLLDEIAMKCLTNGLFVVSTGRHVVQHLHKIPPPALRLTIMAKQSKADIDTAIQVLNDVVADVISKRK